MYKKTKISLSDQSKAIIFGSLLGDGSLRIHKPYRNARFSFRHSIIQEEYFRWKANSLNEIASEKSIFHQSKGEKDSWGAEKLVFQSLALPALTDIYRLTHKGDQFVVRRKWLNMLTPQSLAIWWCDDGSLIGDSRQGVFCTDRFSLKDVKTLDRYMKKVWHITTKVGKVKDRDGYRLWIRTTSDLTKLLKTILPYIPVPSMLPKVIMLYKDKELQQRWISEIVSNSRFSKEVIYNQYRKKIAKWSKFSENDIVQPL